MRYQKPAVDESASEMSDMDFHGPLHQASAEIRQGFVRKVYGILAVQLMLTFTIAGPIAVMTDAAFWRQHMGLYYMALISSVAMICVMACCKETARKFPTNYALLFGITVCESFTVGAISSFYTLPSVFMAVGVTSLAFLVLSIIACTMKIDMGGFSMFMMAASAVLMSAMMFFFMWGLMFPMPSFLHTAIAVGGALFACLSIVYDTKLIVGGDKSGIEFGVDDYCFAALNIYLDLINLFLYILSLFGERD